MFSEAATEQLEALQEVDFAVSHGYTNLEDDRDVRGGTGTVSFVVSSVFYRTAPNDSQWYVIAIFSDCRNSQQSTIAHMTFCRM